jgi:Family of unknown function (DUF6171)
VTSAWQEYKKKLGTTRPWDLVRPNTEYSSQELAAERIEICEKCPRLTPVTYQCKECGCFMKIKVKLQKAACPLEKW